MKRFLLLMCLVTLSAEAKNLGTFGHTFDIIEQDLLEVIEKKLKVLEKDGLIKQHQSLIQEKMEEKIKRPTPVEGIIKTKNPRVFDYDPSIRVPADLKDHKGNVFVKAGTVINPLDTHSLKKNLIFIDGDDKAQVKWAFQKQNLNSKVILVKGAPFALMRFHAKIIYFDQGGRLVKKFGITQVPARISQHKKMLKIEEIEIESTE